MNRNAKLAALGCAALIIIVSAGWYLGSPAWTLRGMNAAAQANDPDALSAYIDYPALREDLKAKIMSQMIAEAQKDKSGIGPLGIAVGSALMSPVIDGLVSPAGMRAALNSRRNEEAAPGTPHAATALRIPDQPVIVRRSFSEFLVTSRNQPRAGLVFKLHGLSWKLSGLALPEDQAP